MSNANPYHTLGVSLDVSDEAIKIAYRKSSLQHHPDKAKRPEDVATATERMKEINEAFEKLKPENREATNVKIRMTGGQYPQNTKPFEAKEYFREAQKNFRRRDQPHSLREKQLARYRLLEQRLNAVHVQYKKLESDYNNLLPLIHLELRGDESSNLFFAHCLLQQVSEGATVHPRRKEWKKRLEQPRTLFQMIHWASIDDETIRHMLNNGANMTKKLEDTLKELFDAHEVIAKEAQTGTPQEE